MRNFLNSHLVIFLTIGFALYSQLVVKWQMQSVGELPAELTPKVIFMIKLLFTPWMLSAAIATFLGGLTWMAAMTRFDLGYAYLYLSLLFFLTMVSSIVLFQEPLNLLKLFGGALILAGIILLGYGQQT